MDTPAHGGADQAGPGREQTNMTARTASGLSWFYLSTMTLMVANLTYTATVSRLLGPSAFGLMAMANLVVLLTQFFAGMGLAPALVQKPDLSRDEIRASSTAGIAIGLACLAVVWILAPAIATLFRQPAVVPVLRALGVSFVFTGWSMTGLGLMRRELRFRTLSLISVGTYVFAYLVVGVGLALLGAGVWSLVAASVTSTAAQAVTNVLFSTLSRIQHDLGRLRRAYHSVLSLGNLMLFPACAGIAVAAQELVRVVLGPQWNLAVGLVPWFALAGGCHVASQLTQLLADARAELNRSLAVQTAYIVGLALLILLALPLRSRGVWVIAAAVAAAEVLRYVGYLALARRVLAMPWSQVWQAHVPAAFASAGVGLAIAAARWALAGHVPTLVVFGAEAAAGVLAFALSIRLCPLPAIREELWMRLTAAGVLGEAGGLRRRLASLGLGRPQPAGGP